MRVGVRGEGVSAKHRILNIKRVSLFEGVQARMAIDGGVNRYAVILANSFRSTMPHANSKEIKVFSWVTRAYLGTLLAFDCVCHILGPTLQVGLLLC